MNIGFYRVPPPAVSDQIETAVREELSGEWNIAATDEDISAEFHQHHLTDGATEFHRNHPPIEPRVIWKRIRLPAWRNGRSRR